MQLLGNMASAAYLALFIMIGIRYAAFLLPRENALVRSAFGVTLTDAVNIFIQQSLNTNGLPFLLSPENAEYLKAKSVQRLMAEVQKGWDSVKTEADWVGEAEVYALLEAEA